jgi:hypothetical protein
MKKYFFGKRPKGYGGIVGNTEGTADLRVPCFFWLFFSVQYFFNVWGRSVVWLVGDVVEFMPGAASGRKGMWAEGEEPADFASPAVLPFRKVQLPRLILASLLTFGSGSRTFSTRPTTS